MNSVISAKPQKPIDLIRAQLYLPSMKEQLATALPTHVSVEKFLRVAMTALQQSPSLLNLDRSSLFASVVTAAQLGLLPDQQLGECYFVPFKGKVTLVPGYRGLIKLARQGDIGFVEAEVICANDRTTYILGDESRFESQVHWQNRGAMVAVYAIARWREGGIAGRVVMTKEQVDGIRARSQNANGPAWTDNYDEMAKKTALRRLAKLLPLSTTAASAFRLSELHEEIGRPGQVIEGQVIADLPPEPVPEPQETKAKRRRTALDGITGDAGGPSVGADPQAADSPRGPSEAEDAGEWDGDGSAPTTNP
jgi:recombination protein RecT